MSIVLTTKQFVGKKILYAVVDQAGVAKKHNILFEKVRDITMMTTSRLSITTHGDTKYFDTIDQAMVASSQYDFVFVQSVGNFIKNNEILLLLEEYYFKHQDFFIVAFTLDWDAEHGTGWVECHHQMMFINVDTWKKLGSPKFGGWETVAEELPNYSRSEENFHDKYTPLWMKGNPGTTLKTRSKQGSGFIKAAFSNGVRIDNFSKQMRDCRLYVYPEHESQKLYDAFINKVWRGVDNPNQQKWIKSLNPKPTIWIYNSERYFFWPRERKLNTYFGPAAGFKFLDVLNFNDDVKFVFYDFQEKSLEWLKELKENWDGNNFPKYLRSKEEYKQYYKYVNGDIDTNQKMLFADFGGEENFVKLWNKFKNCPTEFIKCDLFELDQVKKLLDLSNDLPFFYYSNIFANDYTLFTYTLKEVEEHHNKFLKLIFDRFPNASTHGCNELGIYRDYNSYLSKETVLNNT